MLHRMNPRPRGPWTVRPRAQRGFAPELQSLEGRELLSTAVADPFAPSNAAQYMLELINRARANPAAEGQRILAMVQTNPMLQQTTQGWNLNAFIKEINSFGPEPPLAFNTRLNEAALDHDAAMLAVNAQVHAPAGFLNNPQVAQASDGQPFYPTGTGNWATGENIFAYSAGIDPNNTTAVLNYFEAGFLLDWGNPDFGHLTNILAPGPGEWAPGDPHYPYSEVGIGLLTNVAPSVAPGSNPIAANNGLNVGPDIVTQEFGWRSGNPILTGSFFVDRAGTGFYVPGEGIGGIRITAVGQQGQGTFQTQTWGSGGYSLPLPPGSYRVSATTGGFFSASTTVTLGVDNVLWEDAIKPLPVPAATIQAQTIAPAPTTKPQTPPKPAPVHPPLPAVPAKKRTPAPQPPKVTTVKPIPLAPVATKPTTTWTGAFLTLFSSRMS